ncbi:MAG: sugar ABC transporter substrate-binding protein [Trueperaceae bacterium]|nr:sugar ABC transporter substrate-binding protein [Trueperaceae bacterium]
MLRIKRSFTTLIFSLLIALVSAQTTELTFTFWGSPFEKDAVERMIKSFNESHPNIKVRAQHIPDGYEEKISTMVAGGTPPDVGYLNEGMALQWAKEGILQDLTPYFKEDPEASNRLPAAYYNYDGDKTIGTNTAAETIILYYNKDLFDAAGVSYPPSKAAEAWTWDDFVEAAKKLTVDRNGNNATSPDFNPEQIETYGISFPTWWGGYTPLIYSNGGSIASDDGTEFQMNSPEAVEVLQNMQDLIYVHHVAPTPAQSESLPSADIMMQSRKVAMSIDGHWKVLDYSQLGFNWGIGVLPYYDEPTTILLGAPSVIFSGTKHPEEAFEFYKFHNDPSQVDLYAKGLWMPLQLSYYTDPDKTAEWLDAIEGVYPPEARDVLIDYTLNNTPTQPVFYWLKNAGQIFSEAIDPAMTALWANEMTAQEAMDQAAENAAPLMQGRW